MQNIEFLLDKHAVSSYPVNLLSMKTLEKLHYFPLTDSITLSSAVLKLLTSESLIFRFRTF